MKFIQEQLFEDFYIGTAAKKKKRADRQCMPGSLPALTSMHQRHNLPSASSSIQWQSSLLDFKVSAVAGS